MKKPSVVRSTVYTVLAYSEALGTYTVFGKFPALSNAAALAEALEKRMKDSSLNRTLTNGSDVAYDWIEIVGDPTDDPIWVSVD